MANHLGIYKGTVTILVDRYCASACEQFLLSMQGFGVTGVGEKTAGAVQTGGGGYILLPNSKIVVQVPTWKYDFTGGLKIEGKGIEPDIVPPEGKDSLGFVVERYGLKI